MTPHSHPSAGHGTHDLIAALGRYEDAGVDPAFDAHFDDLEREFAELRLNRNHF